MCTALTSGYTAMINLLNLQENKTSRDLYISSLKDLPLLLNWMSNLLLDNTSFIYPGPKLENIIKFFKGSGGRKISLN